MGTRSSSSAGGGGAPGDSPEGSRSSLGSQGPQDDDEEENVDLAQVLAYLLRRGQVRLVQGGSPASLHLVQSLSDSDDDNDSAWEGCLGDRYSPPVDPTPDTAVLDQNQIRTQVLLASGRLGTQNEQSITRLLLERERGRCRFSPGERSRVTSNFLPNHVCATDSYSQKAFCGVYSPDGTIFMSACQDQNIRLYDCRHGSFKKFRTVKARDVGWSVLDLAFTPDGGHFLYSSWSDYIHVCNINGESEMHTALDLSPSERRFAVFSLTVSSDGREVLGGANDGCVYVYDREQNLRTLK
ncbi:DDB1- and CUL4-associated factor 11-like, partial [Bombina bombina]